jgi:hypothetical protein
MIRIPVNRTFVARRTFISIENNRRLRLNPVEVEHLRRSFYVPEPFSIDMQALTGLSLSRTQVINKPLKLKMAQFLIHTVDFCLLIQILLNLLEFCYFLTQDFMLLRKSGNQF